MKKGEVFPNEQWRENVENSDDCYYENDKIRIIKDYLLSRPTNAKFIYINNILYTVSTATCFDATESASESFILLLC